MTIRYEIDTTGRLHRVVRVVERVVLPEAALPGEPPTALERAAAVIHGAAAGLRAERARLLALRYKDAADRRREARRLSAPQEEARDVTPAMLRAARQAVGLSQRQLAEAFPYGRSLIASVELRRRSCPPDLGAWVKQTLRTTKTEVPQ